MKKKIFEYNCYSEDFSSITDVISHFKDLDKELLDSNLHNLRCFNTTYYIITKNVAERLGSNYFENDDLMEKFDINFSKYYFKALKAYVDKRLCPYAWKECFEQCEQDNSWQFIYMAMGVNAHVNYDLSFVLRDNIQNLSYQKDFDKVNDIISNSVKEVIEQLHESSETLNILEHKLLIMYSIFLNVIIKRWRSYAWENFLNLKYGYIKNKYIEKNSIIILKQIIGVTYFREFFSNTFSKFDFLGKSLT